MRTWTRAHDLTLCGRCAHFVTKGEPLLLIYLEQVRTPKQRCARCAGEPVPEDLAPLPPTSEAFGATT